MMHGRVKVKTTAEQQEAKRKEREKKLKLYTGATQMIFSKRLWLKLIDTYTFYIFFVIIRPEDEVHELFKGELQFLEACLRLNPKSYGVWNHRCFVMETMAKPDWKQELQLCNLFLDYDERNFHCWDYRRFVVKKAEISPEEELEFTTNKICNNFSNFSSWHYRSKLLPIIYPDDSTSVGVEEGVLIKEYETVQNAFFTDPDDQSAWFYHRWLLGRGKRKTGVGCMMVDRIEQKLMITTTQPILISPSTCEVDVSVNGERVDGVWCTNKNHTDLFSHIWIFKSKDSEPWIPSQELVEVTVAAGGDDWGSSDSIELEPLQQCHWIFSQEEQGSRFRDELSAATTDTLERELESIQELYEVEPENKWVLLTIVSLMKALDPLEHQEQIEEFITKLKTIDPVRLNYYEDLRSKFTIENYIETAGFWYKSISSLDVLKPLAHTKLLKLYLFGNPVEENLEHKRVKAIIPTLHNVDGHMY
ncbi:geranylgeranyl transferase type-2 subunit alpha-like [Ruditapes philippinarum]|uniref:geranylgeranyl transferase type-2 subunit alpha-like n=1 Tax=Ruditapes philippinarum TaxID=129788 RepID=UPI00295BBE9C|nr:geranylgeranyl transferase type-2 subunit alpha-like [Ruditapes philippinarum]